MEDRPRIVIAPALDVGLWRLGAAPLLFQTVTRASWVAFAQLAGLGAATSSVTTYFEKTTETLVGLTLAAVAALGFTLVQARLIWMAARRSRSLGLSTQVWPNGLVSVFLLGLAGFLAYDRSVPALVELWQIELGDNELRDGTMTLSADGTELLFAQTFATGTAAVVSEVLDYVDSVKTVRLRSTGGRVSEAYSIYLTIKSRGLDTVVDQYCASACTLAFLGGRQRLIHDGALLAFHGLSFPGLTQSDLRDASRAMQELLVRAGVRESFADRAMNTRPESLWLPTNDEMLEAGVVHRVIPAAGGKSGR